MDIFSPIATYRAIQPFRPALPGAEAVVRRRMSLAGLGPAAFNIQSCSYPG